MPEGIILENLQLILESLNLSIKGFPIYTSLMTLF